MPAPWVCPPAAARRAHDHAVGGGSRPGGVVAGAASVPVGAPGAAGKHLALEPGQDFWSARRRPGSGGWPTHAPAPPSALTTRKPDRRSVASTPRSFSSWPANAAHRHRDRRAGRRRSTFSPAVRAGGRLKATEDEPIRRRAARPFCPLAPQSIRSPSSHTSPDVSRSRPQGVEERRLAAATGTHDGDGLTTLHFGSTPRGLAVRRRCRRS